MEKIKSNCMCYSQKVLPLAFDESLSYLEQVCKINAKLNELISVFNDELSQDLKDYIDENFNNIMLNAMYDDETETIIFYKEDEE